MKAFYKTVGLKVLCGLFGYSRQAYYEYQRREERIRFEDALLVDLILRERKIARRVGGRKLYHILQSELQAHRIELGRDRFFTVMRNNGLLIKPRRKRTITTLSRHRLPTWPNLAQHLQVDRAEQLWVSDITYIRVGQGFCYLILITDAYSRQVMGYHVADKMDTAFCLKALTMALSRRRFSQRKLMHHSDRGMQYCSRAYVAALQQNHIAISMTENGDPLENALAERMNRTFKDHFDIARNFDSLQQAAQAIHLAVAYYNERLPHSSCDMMTPKEAHQLTGTLKKHWKKSATKARPLAPTQ